MENLQNKNIGLPVHGYQPQSEDRVALVNQNKQLEEHILRHLDTMKDASVIDQQWLAVGRTHLEQAFMAINRAVFKPSRVDGPLDL